MPEANGARVSVCVCVCVCVHTYSRAFQGDCYSKARLTNYGVLQAVMKGERNEVRKRGLKVSNETKQKKF